MAQLQEVYFVGYTPYQTDVSKYTVHKYYNEQRPAVPDRLAAQTGLDGQGHQGCKQ